MRISIVQARGALRFSIAESRPLFSWQATRMHGSGHSGEGKETVNINWKIRDGSIVATKAEIGSSLLAVARKYEIELEGACEGVCACSTCHIILEDAVFDALADPTEDEEDMLGKELLLAFLHLIFSAAFPYCYPLSASSTTVLYILEILEAVSC